MLQDSTYRAYLFIKIFTLVHVIHVVYTCWDLGQSKFAPDDKVVSIIVSTCTCLQCMNS